MNLDDLPNLLSGLTLWQKVSQLICPFLYCDQVDDHDALAEELKKNPYGGFILLGGAAKTQTLINRLQQVSPIPLFIAADIECGAGQQIFGAAGFPSNMALAATGKVEYAYLKGYYTAVEAKLVGLNWAFAPVVDVNNNPDNPIINIRAFAEDPATVAQMGAAFIRGCQEQQVIATAKHFPGHGNTHLDSHTALPVIDSSREDFFQIELPPFRAAIQAGVSSIMTAHIAVPALDPEHPELPATLSYPIMTTLLREQMGFDGLIVTDAMIMDGIKGASSETDTAIMALKAGCDVILMPHDPAALILGLIQAIESGTLDYDVVHQAVERILHLKIQYGLWQRRFTTPEQLQGLCQPEVSTVVLRMIQESLTLIRNEVGVVPLAVGHKVLSLVINDDDIPSVDFYWHKTLQSYAAEVQRLEYNSLTDFDEFQSQFDEALAWADQVVVPIFMMIKAAKDRLSLDQEISSLLETIAKSHKTYVLAVFGNPYLLWQYPWVTTYACAYSIHPLADQEMVRALYGALPFVGRCVISTPSFSPLVTADLD